MFLKIAKCFTVYIYANMYLYCQYVSSPPICTFTRQCVPLHANVYLYSPICTLTRRYVPLPPIFTFTANMCLHVPFGVLWINIENKININSRKLTCHFLWLYDLENIFPHGKGRAHLLQEPESLQLLPTCSTWHIMWQRVDLGSIIYLVNWLCHCTRPHS